MREPWEQDPDFWKTDVEVEEVDISPLDAWEDWPEHCAGPMYQMWKDLL